MNRYGLASMIESKKPTSSSAVFSDREDAIHADPAVADAGDEVGPLISRNAGMRRHGLDEEAIERGQVDRVRGNADDDQREQHRLSTRELDSASTATASANASTNSVR